MQLTSYSSKIKFPWLFLKLTTLTLALTLSALAQAETIFEGYSKILLGGKHAGFVVQRYDFDPKKKEYTSIYYNQASGKGGSLAESLKAKANSKFEPISYQYTVRRNKEVLAIDATFKGREMTLTVTDGKKKNTVKKTIPKGTFLSSFLGYMTLTSHYENGKAAGYKVGKKFSFKAISEEDGEAYTGQLFVKEKVPYRGVQTFKVFNKFKGSEFISYVAENGDILGTKSPKQGVSTELAATAQIATFGQKLPTNTLKKLFGRVPTGKLNTLSKLASAKPTTKDPKSGQ